MKALLWWGQGVVSVLSTIGTIIPLAIAATQADSNSEFGGLNWRWWAVIGVVALVVSFGSIILRLYNAVSKLTNAEAAQVREMRGLELERMRAEKDARENPAI